MHIHIHAATLGHLPTCIYIYINTPQTPHPAPGHSHTYILNTPHIRTFTTTLIILPIIYSHAHTPTPTHTTTTHLYIYTQLLPTYIYIHRDSPPTLYLRIPKHLSITPITHPYMRYNSQPPSHNISICTHIQYRYSNSHPPSHIYGLFPEAVDYIFRFHIKSLLLSLPCLIFNLPFFMKG